MIILDTNVVSELMRPSPQPEVVEWVRALPGREVFTTSITLAEIGYGIARLPEGRRRDAMSDIAGQVFTAFSENILSFDAAAAERYPVVVTRRDRAGLPIEGFDAQIASICHVRNATLATRNDKDFRQTGIEIINPWRTSE